MSDSTYQPPSDQDMPVNSPETSFVDFGVQPGEDLTVPIVNAGDRFMQLTDLAIELTKAKEGKTGGEKMLVLTLEDPEVPGAMSVKHWMLYPSPTQKDSTNKFRKQDFVDLCACFGLPLQFSIEQVKLQKPRGFVLIKHEPFNGRQSAKVAAFIKPRSITQ